MTPAVSVLLPYRNSGDPWRERSLKWVWARWAATLADQSVEFVVEDDPAGEEAFSFARAVNTCAELATGKTLVIADADCAIETRNALDAVRLVQTGTAWVLPFRTYAKLYPDDTEDLLGCAPTHPIRMPRRPQFVSRRAVCGSIVLSRSAFDAVNGIDPRFVGWGFNDPAFADSLTTLVGKATRLDGLCLHLHHAQDPDRKANPPSRALGARYAAARGDVDAMTALIGERA